MNPVSIIIIIIFGSFGLLVAGFFFLILKLAMKTKEDYWKGKVIDKLSNVVEDTDDRKSTYLTLVVKTERGETRKIAVTRAMYDSCKVGDALEKPKGKLNPVKVS